jgi:hypothetical protein
MLSLVVNDETGAYVDNTGSYKVLVSNVTTKTGATVGASGFGVAGMSTGVSWTFGLGATMAAPGIAPVAIPVTNTIPVGMGPAGFNSLFVAALNNPMTGLGARNDPYCTCASCGGAGAAGPAAGAAYGCPGTGAGFTVLNGGAALYMFTGPAGGPAAAYCGGPVSTPTAPAAMGACPFNPTLNGGVGSLGGGAGTTSIPALSPLALAILVALILGASLYAIRRGSLARQP